MVGRRSPTPTARGGAVERWQPSAANLPGERYGWGNVRPYAERMERRTGGAVVFRDAWMGERLGRFRRNERNGGNRR